MSTFTGSSLHGRGEAPGVERDGIGDGQWSAGARGQIRAADHGRSLLVAIACTGFVIAVRWPLAPVVSEKQYPYLFLMLGIITSAYIGRLRAGIWAILLSVATAICVYLPPLDIRDFSNYSDEVSVLLFASIGFLMTLTIESLHRSRSVLRSEVEATTLANRRTQEAANRALKILETITDAFFVLDVGGRFLEANMVGVKLAGKSLEWLIGNRFQDVPGIASNKTALEAIERAWKLGEPMHFQTQLWTDDRWFEAHVYPSGERMEVYLHEITERKLAEAAHLEAVQERSRLQAIMEALPVGVAITDINGGQFKVNAAFRQVWGGVMPAVTVEGYKNYRATWIDSGEEVQPQEWASARAIQGEVVTGQVLEIHGFDGVHRVVVNSASPVRDGSGAIIGSAVAIQDVTELVRTRQALRESDDRLRQHVQNSPVAVVEWDQNHVIIRWDGAAERMFGYTAAEAVGATVEQLNFVYEEDHERVGRIMAGLKDGTTSHFSNPSRNRTRDGRILNCEWHSTVLRNKMGAVASVMSLGIDVTERVAAEEKIHELNATLERRVVERTMELKKAVDQLEAEISNRIRLEREILDIAEREQSRLGQDLHDGLGQQLAGVALLGKVLGNRLKSENHPSAESAQQIATYTSQAIESARSLARGMYPVELNRYGLMIALEDLADQIRSRFHIECEIVVNGVAPRLEKLAEIHVYRIVQESISNAIKHGEATRTIVEIRDEENGYEFSVSDNGSGFVDPEEGHSGMGLHLMEYRARVIGGKIRIGKSECGGVRVTCFVPKKAVSAR